MDEKRNKYLIKKYEHTEAEILAMGDACMICGKIPAPDERHLHVDHCHKWKYVKITKVQYADCWQASATYWGKPYCAVSRFRNKAIQEVRRLLKKASVRGVLCFPDNVLLRKAFDQPERLISAGKYLARHQNLTDNHPV